MESGCLDGVTGEVGVEEKAALELAGFASDMIGRSCPPTLTDHHFFCCLLLNLTPLDHGTA